MAPWAIYLIHPIQNMTTHNKNEQLWHNELAMWCILHKTWQHIATHNNYGTHGTVSYYCNTSYTKHDNTQQHITTMAPWASNMMHPIQNMTTHNKTEQLWHHELLMWCILYKTWQHTTTHNNYGTMSYTKYDNIQQNWATMSYWAPWAIDVVHPIQNMTTHNNYGTMS